MNRYQFEAVAKHHVPIRLTRPQRAGFRIQMKRQTYRAFFTRRGYREMSHVQ